MSLRNTTLSWMTLRRMLGGRQRLLLLAAAVLLTVGGVVATVALPAHEIELVYFNQQGETIGGSLLTCNSGYLAWGQQSDWYAELVTSCIAVGPYDCKCWYQGQLHSCPSGASCP